MLSETQYSGTDNASYIAGMLLYSYLDPRLQTVIVPVLNLVIPANHATRRVRHNKQAGQYGEMTMINHVHTTSALAAALLLCTGAAQAITTDIAVNGGFETGNFTGWTQYPSAGTTQTITTTNPSSGTYAANLNIPASAGGVNNVLKQERLLDGTGLLSAGQTIDISFDYRGSGVNGAVLFLEYFCETAGPLCGQNLTHLTPNVNPDVWTNYSATFTLGTALPGFTVDAYTLQFAAVCGATGTCIADYYFDNVVIEADIAAVPVPAAVWLFGSGLVGLVGVARRKKAA
jgi:hypothetical protein